MNTDTFERRSNNLSNTMETQIVSMLKDVIEDDKKIEHDEEFEELSQDRIVFQDEDNESERDETETQSNTIADQTLSHIVYGRDQQNKSLTQKLINTNPIREEVEDQGFERTNKKKSQTQQNFNHSQISYLMSMGAQGKVHTPTNDSSSFARLKKNFGMNNAMNFISFNPQNQMQSSFSSCNNNFNGLNKGFSQMIPIQPMNQFHQIQQQFQQLQQMKPRIQRTFTYKSNYHNYQSNQFYQNSRIPTMTQQWTKGNKMYNDDRMTLELESMLVKTNKFDMDIYNHFKGAFISLIKNQQASRICQFYFDQTPSNVVHLIFEELRDSITQLLLDPYANYFCLKIFYFLNGNDRIAFLENASNNFDILSVNKISTYPIQCIVEHLNTDQEKRIVVNAIKNSYMKLCLDVYGTHVLEKILNCFEYEFVRPLMSFILNNFLFLANNANGLCVVKKEIICENKKENFEQLKKEIITHALVLIQNPYGNYALQTAIDNWDLSDLEELMTIFEGKCSVLSLQKYSSNVIERCIEKNPIFLDKFIKEILSDESCAVGLLLQNSFGNYVVQTALKHSVGDQKLPLIKAIEDNLSKMNEKKLIMKWRSIISAYSEQSL